MKVAVLGAGAVGGMLGGLLKHHAPSLEVLFLARGEHGQQMRRAGHVVLNGTWGTYQVPVAVSDDLSDLAGADVVLLTVKSQQTETTVREARPHLGNAIVVSIQNGINQRVLQNYVPSNQLVAGATATNMAIIAPGAITLQRRGVTVVGPAARETPDEVVDRAFKLLRSTGLPLVAERNILGIQYNKLLFNTMGYASVLSAIDFVPQGLFQRQWRGAVALPILNEGLRTLRAADVELAPMKGLSDVLRLRRLLTLSDRLPGTDVVVRTALALAGKKPLVFSVYQDLCRGRRTEIEFINGEIVRLARQQGMEAPLNALTVAMVHELEQRDSGHFFSRDEVIARFRSETSS